MVVNFLNQENIFVRSNKLLKDVIYISVVREKSFIHIKSIFKDSWYNFIIPIVIVDKFDWKEAKGIIKEEKKDNVEMSFYVHDSLVNDYKESIVRKGYKNFGTDVYMCLELDKLFDDISGDFVALNKDDRDEYLEATVKCFPDWENEKDYSEYFYNLMQTSSENIHHTILLKVNNKLASFGSVVISKKLRLAYLHNLGTLGEYRRKRYAENITKYLCNLAWKNSVEKVYGLLEKDESSYCLFKKQGFRPEEIFYLFVKNNA